MSLLPRAQLALLTLMAIGCAGDSVQRDQADAAASSVELSGDAGPNASLTGTLAEPSRDHGVVRRDCPRTPFGPSWLFIPTSTFCGPRCSTGTACRHNEDCTTKPLGRCIGLDDPECRYNGLPGDLDEVCDVDADCARRRGGRCVREIKHTFCLYDRCESDRDCTANARCQCPTTDADPLCVTAGCDADSDCASGQSCRVDLSVAGAFPLRHCSSPGDECARDADCRSLELDRCGFDVKSLRWICRPLIIVD